MLAFLSQLLLEIFSQLCLWAYIIHGFQSFVLVSHTQRTCLWQTDGRTDGQMDGIAIASTVLAMRSLRRAVKTPPFMFSSVTSSQVTNMHNNFGIYSWMKVITAHCNARIASAVLVTAIPSVCPFVRLSVTRRYCVKTTARSMVKFALSDSKMCLVL